MNNLPDIADFFIIAPLSCLIGSVEEVEKMAKFLIGIPKVISTLGFCFECRHNLIPKLMLPYVWGQVDKHALCLCQVAVPREFLYHF